MTLVASPDGTVRGLYGEQMALPSNGTDARYAFEYGDALFVVLDVYCADPGEEEAWLSQPPH